MQSGKDARIGVFGTSAGLQAGSLLTFTELHLSKPFDCSTRGAPARMLFMNIELPMRVFSGLAQDPALE